MEPPQEPLPPQPEQQVPMIPWGWEFHVVGDSPNGKVMLAKIIRPPFETFALLAVLPDMKRFHQALGEAIRQVDGGITPASAVDIAALVKQKWIPPNGTGRG